jgi:hypothetical protein
MSINVIVGKYKILSVEKYLKYERGVGSSVNIPSCCVRRNMRE